MKISYLMFCTLMMAMVASIAEVPKLEAQQAQLPPQILNMLGGGGGTAGTPDQMQDLLKLRIEEIGSIVDLEEQQVGKLNLAAKVVARKVFEEQKSRFAMRPGQGQSPSDDDDDSFSDDDAESQADTPSQKDRLREVKSAVALSTALKHKTWINAVKSILTDTQQTGLSEYAANRNQKIRDVAVQYRVWQLAQRLRLNQDQIQPVTEVVDRIEGDDLVKQMGKEQRGISIRMAGTKEPKKVSPDDLKDVLSETQMKLFQKPQGGPGGVIGRVLFGNKESKDTLEKRGVQLDADADRPTVESVTAGSQLEKMGVLRGDFIDEVNGKPVDTLIQINRVLEAEGKLSLTVIRDGKTIQLESDE